MITYQFFHELITFVASHWKESNNFFTNDLSAFKSQPKMEKWLYFFLKDRKNGKSNVYYQWKRSNVTNVTESKKGTFYVMIRKKKKLVKKTNCLNLSKIYLSVYINIIPENLIFFLMNCFPYFCLLKNYSNYHFHFLIIKNEHICHKNSIF